MSKANKNIQIDYLDLQYTHGFLILHQKGYCVDRLCTFRGKGFYDEYKECPMEFITFKDFVNLPNVPIDFELAHITDEKQSLLLHRYADGLSRKQLLRKRAELADAFMHWALCLPHANSNNEREV